MTARRTFVCRECLTLHAADTSTGPLPSVCDTCAPDAAARRALYRAHKRQVRQGLKQRAEAAERRVDELEAALAARGMDLARVRAVGRPDRATLGRAVRRVAAATGRHGTIDALRTLAAVALAWAAVLDVDEKAGPSIGERA